jgi:hypothetical protein
MTFIFGRNLTQFCVDFPIFVTQMVLGNFSFDFKIEKEELSRLGRLFPLIAP